MKITGKRYLQGFGLTVIFLAFIRCLFPSTAGPEGGAGMAEAADSAAVVAPAAGETGSGGGERASTASRKDSFEAAEGPLRKAERTPSGKPSRFFRADGSPVKNPIYSVPNFRNTFPDQNDVQLVAAQKYGVKAVEDRDDAEKRKSELVYIGSNPYFHVDRLRNSIPYLVPRASVLLQDIGRSFFDSLQIKGIPLHKIIVTSVLRSKDDIRRLRGHNSNAKENSCHLYGTTFDICYNRYETVEDPEGPQRRRVRNDTLKWVLSEVLDDMRQQKRCLIKYEVKQGCFHITVN